MEWIGSCKCNRKNSVGSTVSSAIHDWQRNEDVSLIHAVSDTGTRAWDWNRGNGSLRAYRENITMSLSCNTLLADPKNLPIAPKCFTRLWGCSPQPPGLVRRWLWQEPSLHSASTCFITWEGHASFAVMSPEITIHRIIMSLVISDIDYCNSALTKLSASLTILNKLFGGEEDVRWRRNVIFITKVRNSI